MIDSALPTSATRRPLPTLLYVQPLKEGTEPSAEPRFPITHPYVEQCWLPVIGPSATWCLRRLDIELDAHPRGTAIDLTTLARDLGLSEHLGRRAPLAWTLQRLSDFGLARVAEGDTLEVRRLVPPVGARSATRLSLSVQRTHREMVAVAGNPFLSAALAYAERGMAVLPLKAEEKVPDGRLVPRGLHDASTDPTRLRSWWAHAPNANVGIRTGGALDVVDLDSSDARRALEAIAPTPLRPSIVVATPRGFHLWFAASGLPTRAGVMEHIDLRGAGGYVVAPPSQLSGGQTYRFVDQQIGGLTTQLPRAHLFPAPVWLIDQLGSFRAAPNESPPVARVDQGRSDQEHYVRAALYSESREVANAPEGSRNDRLNRAAFSLGTLVGARVLHAAEAEEHLLQAALAAGLDRGESLRTITSGLTAGEQRPRTDAAALRPPDRSEPSEIDSRRRSAPSESASAAVLARVRPRSSPKKATRSEPVVSERSVMER